MQIKTQIEKYIRTYSDDKTQNQAMRLALLFTLIIWVILFVILAVAPGLNQKKKYKTVQITLAPVEKIKPEEKIKTEQKVAGKAAAFEGQKQAETQKQSESVKKTESVKQAQSEKKSQDTKPKTSEAQKTNSSSAPKKTENSAKPAASAPKKANIKYAKSVDELLEEQNSSSKSKNFDWDSMDFTENTNSSGSGKNTSAQNTQKLDSSDALSGTAGTKTEAGGRISSETQKTSAGTNASSSTLSWLGVISKSSYSSTAAAGLDSVAKGINQHSNGKFSIAMTDGSPRILVFPAEPRLIISEENSKTIDSTKNLMITMKILADGTVPLGGVSFSPSSALDSAVRSELAAQIQTWRFSSASSDGQAGFYYSIIKR